MSQADNSEAAAHYPSASYQQGAISNSVINHAGWHYPHVYPSYPYSRQKKVIITKEYDEQGRVVKETRTEEWEPGYTYPHTWYSGGLTYNSTANNIRVN